MKYYLYQDDLPDGLDFPDMIAIDTETLGLSPHRDRLCLIQISGGDGVAHLVQFTPPLLYKAPNLYRLLVNPNKIKIFHYARFDLAILRQYLDVNCRPIWCTRTASKLVRTYTDRHGLRDLCAELLNIEISKQQQSSDWGAASLTTEQLHYAASDVWYLHALRDQLVLRLEREDRMKLAQACFDFLPNVAKMDLLGWDAGTLLAH